MFDCSQVGKSGVAVGIEHIDELVQTAVSNVSKDPVALPLLSNRQLQFTVGDGRKGYEALSPYDAIHVGAAAPEVPQAVSCLFHLPCDNLSYFKSELMLENATTTNKNNISERENLWKDGSFCYLSFES